MKEVTHHFGSNSMASLKERILTINKIIEL